jgi:putative transposase
MSLWHWRCGMRTSNPHRYFKTSREVIRLAVMVCIRCHLPLRDVEDMLHELANDIS